MKWILPFVFSLVSIELNAQENVWYNSLEEALKNPTSVYRLQLKRKGLNEFPKELGLFPNLIALDLSKNKIQQFPNHLDDLAQLTFLDLSRNDISEIPSNIHKLSSLEYLDLWDNDIDSIPENILKIKHLNYLDVRGVAMKRNRYETYIKWMNNIEFYLSEPCDCQE